jgi:hypothetical protein
VVAYALTAADRYLPAPIAAAGLDVIGLLSGHGSMINGNALS